MQSATRSLSGKAESWPLARTFAISRGTKVEAQVVVVEITEGEHRGWGECVPYARYDETAEGVIADIEVLRDNLEQGLSRIELQEVMPAGAARNAIDCAFWDLEAKMAGKPVWQLAGLPEPQPVLCAETISMDTPTKMGLATAAINDRPLLKVKVDGGHVLERLKAVRAAAPDARLIVDANEGWVVDQLNNLMLDLSSLGVEMIEQPVKAGEDIGLVQSLYPITLCADESCHGTDDLGMLKDGYGMVNIKLDKTGGLTEAITMAKRAKGLDFKIMIGCMVGTSLGMAPASLLGRFADYVDLDGPLWLAEDRDHPLSFDNGLIGPPKSDLWG